MKKWTKTKIWRKNAQIDPQHGEECLRNKIHLYKLRMRRMPDRMPYKWECHTHVRMTCECRTARGKMSYVLHFQRMDVFFQMCCFKQTSKWNLAKTNSPRIINCFGTRSSQLYSFTSTNVQNDHISKITHWNLTTTTTRTTHKKNHINNKKNKHEKQQCTLHHIFL